MDRLDYQSAIKFISPYYYNAILLSESLNISHLIIILNWKRFLRVLFITWTDQSGGPITKNYCFCIIIQY